uniref:Uncharacterized protein n=1 Tax=Tetraselmis sp. GSL018 TaxID=582737 RepID=A0A061RBF5_9CHLO
MSCLLLSAVFFVRLAVVLCILSASLHLTGCSGSPDSSANQAAAKGAVELLQSLESRPDDTHETLIRLVDEAETLVASMKENLGSLSVDLKTSTNILTVISNTSILGVFSTDLVRRSLYVAHNISDVVMSTLGTGKLFEMKAARIEIMVAKSNETAVYDELKFKSGQSAVRFPEELQAERETGIRVMWSQADIHRNYKNYRAAVSGVTNVLFFEPDTGVKRDMGVLDRPILVSQSYLSKNAQKLVCNRYDRSAGEWSTSGVVTLPIRRPRGMEIRPNLDFLMSDVGKRPFWDLVTSRDCRTAATQEPLDVCSKSMACFGAIVLEGTDCPSEPALVSGQEATDELQKGCFWDQWLQEFFGQDCIEERYLSCMSNQFGDFRVAVEKVGRTFVNTYRIDVGPQQSSDCGTRLPGALLIFLGLLCVFAMLGFWARRCDLSQRAVMMQKLMSIGTGFHPMQGSKPLPPVKVDNAGNSNSDASTMEEGPDDHVTWIWTLETHMNACLRDDMTMFMEYENEQRRLYRMPGSSQATLGALMGLPLGRVMLCFPDAESLSWVPANKDLAAGDVHNWRNEAVGTSLVMAFISSRRLVPLDVFEQQVRRMEGYFQGCHPFGIRALILRCKVMLNGNIHKPDWYKRSCIWRLVWLQRGDGLWDLTNDFAKAIGAEPDMLMPVIAMDNEVSGLKIIKKQVPSELEIVFSNDPDMMYRIWCTMLAKIYLERQTEYLQEFTGREPDPARRGTPSLYTAEDALAICLSPDALEGAPPLKTLGGKSLYEKVLEDAAQVVKSLQNLRTARLQKMADFMRTSNNHGQNKDSKSSDAAKGGAESQGKKISPQDVSMLGMGTRLQLVHREMRMALLKQDLPFDDIKALLTRAAAHMRMILRVLLNGTSIIRVFRSSVNDSQSHLERSIVIFSAILVDMVVNILIFYNRSLKCCDEQRLFMSDIGAMNLGQAWNSTRAVLARVTNVSLSTPGGGHAINQTVEFAPYNSCCLWLQSQFQPDGHTCDVWPVISNPIHAISVALVSWLCSLPIKILLRICFRFERSIYKPLWHKELADYNLPCITLESSERREEKHEKRMADLLPVNGDDTAHEDQLSPSMRKSCPESEPSTLKDSPSEMQGQPIAAGVEHIGSDRSEDALEAESNFNSHPVAARRMTHEMDRPNTELRPPQPLRRSLSSFEAVRHNEGLRGFKSHVFL